jgi:predicted negative regulator of RcsB-dependent stress response
MKNNSTLLIVGVLVIVASALGYWIYQDQQKSGIDITVGGSGITVRER